MGWVYEPKESCIKWEVHIGAAWRMRWTDSIAAEMRPYPVLLWLPVYQLVIVCAWNVVKYGCIEALIGPDGRHRQCGERDVKSQLYQRLLRQRRTIPGHDPWLHPKMGPPVLVLVIWSRVSTPSGTWQWCRTWPNLREHNLDQYFGVKTDRERNVGVQIEVETADANLWSQEIETGTKIRILVWSRDF